MSEKILEEAETTVITKNFIEIKRHVLRKCKVNSYTNNFEFVDALSEMEGTYTTRNGTEYTLIHDSMLEIIAYHFGCQFPDLILQFMSSSYIANNVKVQENKPINGNNELSGEGHNRLYSESKSEPYDLCIKLREEMYLMLAERLYRDIENMELYDVFMNNVLKEPRVYQAFEEVLETKSDTELESLFLSERTDISKVMNKCERDSKELNSDRGRQNALLNKESESKTKHLIRVISWVIYYGHNRILQYILKRMEDERRAPVLFKNITMNEINEKYRLLLLSCYSGDLKIVKICMKYLDNDTLNTVLRRTLSWYKCPLTAACEGGNISIVKELLVAGASANLPSESTTPLIAACRYGHMDVAKELIKAGAEVNFKVHNETPLMAALIKGHASVVQELIKLKADINLPGGYDFKGSSDTPLSLACRTGNESIVKDLLKAGADVNVKGSSDTPLSLACRTGNESIVKDLLKAGADVNIKGSSDTPLSLACSNGNICIVKDLIKAGPM
ncbi:uncharacterized protein LOC134248246 [Saccostrea cucullata]|uniref:uncharacterized protein LOC134248246 n=1 Tax=Saccostrea cuccullata TaxID=36930 RepID=UPI002ED1FA55